MMKREKAGLKQKGILGNTSANAKSHTNCPVMYIRHIKSLDLFLFICSTEKQAVMLYLKSI